MAPVSRAASRFNPAVPATVAFDVPTKISDAAFVATLTEAIPARGWTIEKTRPLEPVVTPKPDAKAKQEGAFHLSYKGNTVILTYDDSHHVHVVQTGGKGGCNPMVAGAPG